MCIKIKNRAELIMIIDWSLTDVPILNDELLKMTKEYSDKIERKYSITNKEMLSDDKVDLKELINTKIANYLFKKYKLIIVTEEEKLIGVNGEIEEELYDGQNFNLYVQAKVL